MEIKMKMNIEDIDVDGVKVVFRVLKSNHNKYDIVKKIVEDQLRAHVLYSRKLLFVKNFRECYKTSEGKIISLKLSVQFFEKWWDNIISWE